MLIAELPRNKLRSKRGGWHTGNSVQQIGQPIISRPTIDFLADTPGAAGVVFEVLKLDLRETIVANGLSSRFDSVSALIFLQH